jgi:tetratricopeptide (TPR) repeat protein
VRWSSAALVVLLLGLRAAPAAADSYDSLQSLIDDEARDAMASGDYARASFLFWRLLQINPNDVKALRESGRCAQALGNFTYAEKTLARVAELQKGVPDPEVHYLRGEALLALHRDDEAKAEFARAELLLPRGPKDRLGSLWLARIHALRGELDRAEALYKVWLTDYVGSSEYAEIMTLRAEAHILSRDWEKARMLVAELVDHQPGNQRGRELLAWILEAKGDIDDELALRRSIADEMGPDAGGRRLRYAPQLPGRPRRLPRGQGDRRQERRRRHRPDALPAVARGERRPGRAR